MLSHLKKGFLLEKKRQNLKKASWSHWPIHWLSIWIVCMYIRYRCTQTNCNWNLSPVTLNATNPFLSWDITVWRFYRQIKFFFRWLLNSASGLGAIWSESIHLLSSFGCLKCWNETFTVDPVIASLFAFFGKPRWPIWWIFAVSTLTCDHLDGKAETAKAEAFLVDKLVDNNLFCRAPQFGR